MPRATDARVTAILGKVKAGVSLTGFITTANILVEKLLASYEGDELSTEQITEVENYLAAHYYRITYPARSSESAGVSESKLVSVARGLAQTREGETAMFLDTTGTLLDWNNSKGKKRPKMRWLGTQNPSSSDETEDSL